jgi:hypothetical protein
MAEVEEGEVTSIPLRIDGYGLEPEADVGVRVSREILEPAVCNDGRIVWVIRRCGIVPCEKDTLRPDELVDKLEPVNEISGMGAALDDAV